MRDRREHLRFHNSLQGTQVESLQSVHLLQCMGCQSLISIDLSSTSIISILFTFYFKIQWSELC